MRRDRFVATAVSAPWAVVFTVMAVTAGTPAFGAPSSPSATGSAPGPTPGQAVCSIGKNGPDGISGIVARPNGFVVVNDSQAGNAAAKIFFLDSTCKLQGAAVSYTSNGPYDVEDLAQDSKGTLWIADIGDDPPSAGGSAKRRDSIALWTLGSGPSQRPVIHRFKYPDGAHDAEALVLSGDGTPVIVTKEDEKVGAASGLYVPAAPMKDNNSAADAVPLRRAGEFKPPATTTPNPLSATGHQLVTGGASAPDGKRVVLRTYADAFEWDVPDGDVVKAIAKGTPRSTPLPNEAVGEAITYSVDGKSFLTISDVDDGRASNPILKYTPAIAVKPLASKKPADKSKPMNLTMQDLMFAVAAVGVLGLILVIVGVLGIRRSRQVRRAAAVASKAKAKATAGTARPLALTAGPGEISGSVRGGEISGSVRGGGEISGSVRGGGVYGKPAGGGSGGSGGVYGGRSSQSSNVYGSRSGGSQRGDSREYPSGDVSRHRGSGTGAGGGRR